MVVKTVSNPSLITYNNLQRLYSDILRCPCSNMTIVYRELISLSPRFHQVCSSELVREKWISILKQIVTPFAFLDWRNKAYHEFQLLSDLCRLANTTIDDAINRFLLKSFIASSVLTEIDFKIQLESIVNQFINSTIIYFGHLIDLVDLIMQVDQPYMGKFVGKNIFESDFIPIPVINKMTNQSSIKVCLFFLFTNNGKSY